MSYRATLRRYMLILEKVSKPPYPSLVQLKETILELGLKTSNRTLQRDIESIRDEFGIEIIYDRTCKGYRLDEEHSLNHDTFVRFLKTFQLAELLGNNLKTSHQALPYIQFENTSAMQGIHWLKDILHAIRERRVIEFTHHNFQKNTIKTVRLKPYILKEYLNRWYVVGKPEGKKEFRTYGVDRIEALQVLNEKFTLSKTDHPAKFFEQAIGVVYSGDEPEDVLLEFTPLQGNYVKTLPWHPSQTIIKDDKKSLQIKLHVVINYELVRLILMHGKTVKVLHPRSLIKEIKKHLQDNLQQYEK